MFTILNNRRRSFGFLFVLSLIAGYIFLGPALAQAEELSHIPFEERVEMALCEAEGVQPEEVAEFNRIYRKLGKLIVENKKILKVFPAEAKSEGDIGGADYSIRTKYDEMATRMAEMQSEMLDRMVEYLEKQNSSISVWQIPPPPMTPLP